MTKLSQIIAVEKGVKSDAARRVTDLYREVQKAPLLTGIAKTYEPRDELGEVQPPEYKLVQVTAEGTLTEAAAILTRLFDLTLTKDMANCSARADVAVGGRVLLHKVPVTYLLFLEKQLADVHALVAKLPVLDPAQEWNPDDALGVFRTQGAKRASTRKEFRNHILHAPTKEHPAQVQVFTEDIPVGDWTTINFSGAAHASRVRQILDRVEELQRAVKFAREEANTFEVVDTKAGDPVFRYLFAA